MDMPAFRHRHDDQTAPRRSVPRLVGILGICRLDTEKTILLDDLLSLILESEALSTHSTTI